MKRFVLTLLVFVLTAVSATAEKKADITLRISEDEDPVVTITGTSADSSRIYEQITLEVLKCSDEQAATMEEAYAAALTELSEIGENEDMTGVLVHYDTALTDLSGNYLFSYLQEKTSGTYAVRLYGEYSDEAEYYLYTYTDAKELAELLAKFNAAGAGELAELIESGAAKLNIDTTVYSTLDKHKVCEILAGLKGEGFSSANDLSDKFNEAIVLEQLNEASDAAQLKSIAEKNENLLALTSTGFYPTFSSLSTDIQNAVYDKLAKVGGFTTAEGVRTAFCEKGFLTACEKMVYWSQMRPIITQNAQWLELDLTDYKNSKAQAADMAMVGKSYEDISLWKSAFYASMLSGGSNIVTGGGGGSGGSSGAVSSVSPISIGMSALPSEEEKLVRESSFSDMGGYEWAYDAVEALAEMGVISGYGDGAYMPQKAVTRGEFAKMAACAFGLVKNGSRCDFADVSRDDWQYVYIASLYTTGIVSGVSEEEFGVNEAVTREQIAAILTRIAAKSEAAVPKLREKTVFADEAEISEFAVTAVETMQTAGVLSGRDDGRFDPSAPATRAEVAVMIHRLYEILKG